LIPDGFTGKIIPSAQLPSNINEHQKYFLGKGGRCAGLTTLPPLCADYLEIWSNNLLEQSGTVQPFNGIALHLIKFLLSKRKAANLPP
jgi:hypothetical protein